MWLPTATATEKDARRKNTHRRVDHWALCGECKRSFLTNRNQPRGFFVSRATVRRQAGYTIAQKRAALSDLALEPTHAEVKAVAKAHTVKVTTLRDWMSNRDKIMNFKGSEKRKTVGGQGRRESMPFAKELVEHMRSQRADDEVVSGPGMMQWVKLRKKDWCKAYVEKSQSAEHAVTSPLRMCERHAVSYTKAPTEELLIMQADFADDFWSQQGDRDPSEIINIDETAVYETTPPTRFYAEKGGSAKSKYSQKHSDRITAVFAVRADGVKLPIGFIVKGKPGGLIEETKLPTCPPGHFYYVPENAGMDEVVWKKYVNDMLRYEVDRPSVILLDNFEPHVSVQSEQLILEATGSMVVPLPANATSVCQPLDVGVMGPVKKRMKSAWLTEDHAPKTAAEKRRAMIQRTIDAFMATDATVIASSFEKAIPKNRVWPEVQV